MAAASISLHGGEMVALTATAAIGAFAYRVTGFGAALIFMTAWHVLNGFEVLQGQRQNILIPPEKLQLGTYYIGIYDIWGHTALPEESHDDVNYTMYVSKYQAGVPCPKGPENRWCSGITHNLTAAATSACDFNTGVCDCPDNALGLDCSLDACELIPGAIAGSVSTGAECAQRSGCFDEGWSGGAASSGGS